MSISHSVYRCFDADGRLLYIGCTKDVAERMGVHRRSRGRSPVSDYLNQHMVDYTVEAYPDRRTARAAERAAITVEAPLLNTRYNQGRGLALDWATAYANAKASA